MMTTGVLQEEEPTQILHQYCGTNSCRRTKMSFAGVKSAHSGGGAAVSFVRSDGWRWIGGCRMLERGEGRPTSLRPAD